MTQGYTGKLEVDDIDAHLLVEIVRQELWRQRDAGHTAGSWQYDQVLELLVKLGGAVF